MEEAAFSRALRFLNYQPGFKWLALISSVLTAALYVALLLVLGLFADLVVSRGSVPEWRELPRRTQDRLRQSLPAETLASRGLRDAAWRQDAIRIVSERVGPEAADVMRSRAGDDGIADVGILSLVVRTDGRAHARFVGWIARWNPWLWRSKSATWPNIYYGLTGLFFWAALLAVLRALFRFLLIYGAAQATVEASTRLRRAVYHHTFRLGNLALSARGPTEAVNVLTREVGAVHAALYSWLTVVFREPVKLILLLLFAVFLDFWLCLAFLLFALMVWLVGGQVAAYYRRQGKEALGKASEQLSLIQESVQMMRLVKMYMMDIFNQARVERQLSKYGRAQLLSHLGEAVYRPLLVLLATLAAGALMGVMGIVVYHGQAGLATTVALAVALISLYGPLVHLLEERRVMRRGREASIALFEFLDRKSQVRQADEAEFLPPLESQLELKDVTLLEPQSTRMLLQGVNLKIAAGERVGIVGSEEAEKLALVYLLTRLFDPSSGEIRFDEKNIRWVTLDSLRAQIGVVLQRDLVFNDTVATNIGCGDPGFSLPRIIEAAKIAHAHQLIQKLPQGYETPIGALGHALTRDEQMLIAMARAVLREPALYVIEEPIEPMADRTKALMEDTFARILPGRTVIFLPHRVQTIRECDRILLLNRGRIEAAAPHRELVMTNDLYRHLHYLEFNEIADQLAS